MNLNSWPIRAMLFAGLLVSSSFGAIITESTGPLPANITGILPDQGSVLLEQFTLASISNVTITTTSYANGGFQPNLFLYNGAGNFLGSGIPFGSADPSTGLVGDMRLLVLNLPAGTYTVALTDFLLNQSLTATNLSDGFTANFGSGSSFMDANGNTRTGNYALSIVTPSAVPEPGTILLSLTGLGLVFWRARRARR